MEKDPSSFGTIATGPSEVRLDYRLKAGEESSQYVGMAADLNGSPTDANAIVLRLRASKPDRVLVQLRSAGGARQIASVFVAAEERRFVLPVSMFRPAERSQGRFDLREASSLLIVADLTNHVAGASGAPRSFRGFARPGPVTHRAER